MRKNPLIIFFQKKSYKSDHYAIFESQNPTEGHFFSKIFNCTDQTQLPLSKKNFSNYKQKLFWLKKQKGMINKTKGKPTKAKEHLNFTHKFEEKFAKKKRPLRIKRKEALNLGSRYKSERLSLGRQRINLGSGASERRKFRVTDSHGGYFHQYEYIEDPGKPKEKELKDYWYHLRR